MAPSKAVRVALALAALAVACAGTPSAPVCADMSIGGQMCASRELLASSTVLRVWQQGAVPAGGKFVGALLPAAYRIFKSGVDAGSAAAFVSNGLTGEKCYNGGTALPCALVRTFPMAQGANQYLAVGYAYTAGSTSTVGTASNKVISSLVPSRVTYLGHANTMLLTVPTANAWGDEVQLIYGTADAKTTSTLITGTPNLVATVSFAEVVPSAAPTTAAPTTSGAPTTPAPAPTSEVPAPTASAEPTSTPVPSAATATPTVATGSSSPTTSVQNTMTQALFGNKGALVINVLDMTTFTAQMQLTMTVPAGFNGYVSFGFAPGAKAHAAGSVALVSFPVNGVFAAPELYSVLPNNTVAPVKGQRRLQVSSSSPFCNGRPNGVTLTGTTLIMSVCGSLVDILGYDAIKSATSGTIIASYSPSSGADLSVAHSPLQAAAVSLSATTGAPTTAAPTTAAPAPANNTGAIVGGVIGGLVALALIVGGLFYWHKQQQNKGSAPATKDVESDASPGAGEVAKM
jgi:hypothetical protein